MEVLKACLQTHEDNPNRVKVVLEELAGVGDIDMADLEMEDQTVTVDKELISNKSIGKGKGNSSMVKRRGAPAPVESDNSAKHRKLECLSDLKKFFVIVKNYFLLEPCL